MERTAWTISSVPLRKALRHWSDQMTVWCLSPALCGAVEVTGEVQTDGRGFGWIQALAARAGGDGGGMERTTVVQSESPVALERKRCQRCVYWALLSTFFIFHCCSKPFYFLYNKSRPWSAAFKLRRECKTKYQKSIILILLILKIYFRRVFTPQVYAAQQEYDELSAFEEIQQELIAQGYISMYSFKFSSWYQVVSNLEMWADVWIVLKMRW